MSLSKEGLRSSKSTTSFPRIAVDPFGSSTNGLLPSSSHPHNTYLPLSEKNRTLSQPNRLQNGYHQDKYSHPPQPVYKMNNLSSYEGNFAGSADSSYNTSRNDQEGAAHVYRLPYEQERQAATLEATYQPPPPVRMLPAQPSERAPPRPLPSVNEKRVYSEMGGELGAATPHSRYRPAPVHPPPTPYSLKVYEAPLPADSLLFAQSGALSPTTTLPPYTSPSLPPGQTNSWVLQVPHDYQASPIFSPISPVSSSTSATQNYYPSPPPSQHGTAPVSSDSIVSLPTSAADNESVSTLSDRARSLNKSTSHSTFRLRLTQTKSSTSSSSRENQSKAFIFPGGRSTAKPRVGTAQGLQFRKNKEEELAPIDKQNPTPAIPSAATPYPHSATVEVSSPIPKSSNRVSPVSSRSASSNSVRARTVSGSTKGSKPGEDVPFVFPSGRSRARPKAKTNLPAPAAAEREGPVQVTKAKNFRKVLDPSGKTEFMEYEEKSKFMGFTIKKKKKLIAVPQQAQVPPVPPLPSPPSLLPVPSQKAPGQISAYSSNFENFAPQLRSQPPPLQDYTSGKSPHMGTDPTEPANIPKYFNTYPLSSYDSMLLRQDELTTALLRQLNGTGSPTFHNFGNDPPSVVLDLGCGQGHWVLDAAKVWKGYGTHVIGYDLVDVSRRLLPPEYQHGTPDNTTFIKGNFLKEKLPFVNESIDFVRMANLSLCIPTEHWQGVLTEVARVLRVGGRLEVIDDHIFFPLAKISTSDEGAAPVPPTPRLDASAPSTPLNDSSNDSGGVSFIDLRESRDTPNGNPRPATIISDHYSSGVPAPLDDLSHPWLQQVEACQGLEAAFEDLINIRFGIDMHPSKFLLDMMRAIFKHSRKIGTLHVTLAPADNGLQTTPNGKVDNDASSSLGSGLQCPGVVLWPSTFIPMSANEVKIHALRNLRILLAMKDRIIEFAQDELDGETDAIEEALWEYERFMPERFALPPDLVLPGAHPNVPTNALPNAPQRRDQKISTTSDAANRRGSVFSSMSYDTWDAAKEYQTDIHKHLGWRTATPDLEHLRSDSPPTPKADDFPRLDKLTTPRAENAQQRVSIAPPYSRTELTHIRTFHVFEAIKLGDYSFGSAI